MSMPCHHAFDEDGDCIRCGADLFADPRPASMLRPFTFGDDDEGSLRVVSVRPVTEAEEAEDCWQ